MSRKRRRICGGQRKREEREVNVKTFGRYPVQFLQFHNALSPFRRNCTPTIGGKSPGLKRNWWLAIFRRVVKCKISNSVIATGNFRNTFGPCVIRPFQVQTHVEPQCILEAIVQLAVRNMISYPIRDLSQLIWPHKNARCSRRSRTQNLAADVVGLTDGEVGPFAVYLGSNGRNCKG